MQYDPKGNPIKTFKVIDPESGGTLSHIKLADNERDNDSIETREAKRRAQAERQAQAWMQNFYNNAKTLKVVEG